MIDQTLLYFRISIENGVINITQTAPRFHYETKSNVHFVEIDYTSKLLSVKQFHTPNDHMIIGDTFTLHKGHLGRIHYPGNILYTKKVSLFAI